MPIAPEVRSHIEDVLREYLELDAGKAIEWDENDGISISWLETDVSVWLLDHNPPLVRVSARMLRELPPTPELYEAVNALNSGILSTRIVVMDDNIVARLRSAADSITASELAYMLWAVATATKDHAPDLQARFGGPPPRRLTPAAPTAPRAAAGRRPRRRTGRGRLVPVWARRRRALRS